eukprot:scaffold2200_cov145-Isochrysis_galbana.AAC.1
MFTSTGAAPASASFCSCACQMGTDVELEHRGAPADAVGWPSHTSLLPTTSRAGCGALPVSINGIGGFEGSASRMQSTEALVGLRAVGGTATPTAWAIETPTCAVFAGAGCGSDLTRASGAEAPQPIGSDSAGCTSPKLGCSGRRA